MTASAQAAQWLSGRLPRVRLAVLLVCADGLLQPWGPRDIVQTVPSAEEMASASAFLFRSKNLAETKGSFHFVCFQTTFFFFKVAILWRFLFFILKIKL